MKNRLTLCFVVLSLFLLFSCQQSLIENSTDAPLSKALETDESIAPVLVTRVIKDVGVIRYLGLEGGFFGIVGKTGKYDPVNLPREFMQNGLKVQFTAEICTDLASFHMWGTLVKLISIQTTASIKKIIMDTGVMHQYLIQGSPWIIAATTASYQPINLPVAFQAENMKVCFVGVIRTDIVLIPALWPLVELIRIEKIADAPIQVNLYEEFKLQVSKSAIVPRHNVLLTFKSVVGDSRCPSDVVCFWQGEAVIIVNIKIGNADYGDFKMSTYKPNVIYAGSYYVQFNNLYPYPATNIRINPYEYIGYFIIGSILDSALDTVK